KIDIHDIQTKASHANRFLKAGDKVKVVVKFRGREMAHTELGYEIAERFCSLIEENGMIEKPAKLEGRNMIMVLAPKKEKK
ncbi:MAG: translation initiation factor IF-3, partial [Clostridia bacterium]|nr:translation initiation factor IF-3 [Clostridia bacterium]